MDMNQTSEFFDVIDIWFAFGSQLFWRFFFILLRGHQISEIICCAYDLTSKILKQFNSLQHRSSHLNNCSIEFFGHFVFLRCINSGKFHFDISRSYQIFKFAILFNIIKSKNYGRFAWFQADCGISVIDFSINIASIFQTKNSELPDQIVNQKKKYRFFFMLRILYDSHILVCIFFNRRKTRFDDWQFIFLVNLKKSHVSHIYWFSLSSSITSIPIIWPINNLIRSNSTCFKRSCHSRKASSFWLTDWRNFFDFSEDSNASKSLLKIRWKLLPLTFQK